MRITSWNCLHGQGLNPAEEADFGAVARGLGSDVLALQEVDHAQERSSLALQSADIADAISAHFGALHQQCRELQVFLGVHLTALSEK